MGRGRGEPDEGPADQEEARILAAATEAARLRVDQTSLRAVAREIGMSPSGLRGVLDGTEVYGRTRERLLAWFAALRGLGDFPAEAAENTLTALLRSLPEPHGGAAVLLDCVETLHTRAGVDVPGWLVEVRDRLAARLLGVGDRESTHETDR